MVRNIVLLGGNSHPELVENIANILCIPQCNRILTKFSGGESRCEIKDSVRGKDVYIVQSGAGQVNDHLIDLCIMISACKTGSAKRVTAVVPLFPYSRQSDWPYSKSGAPLSNSSARKDYTFESVPPTPRPGGPRSNGLSNGVNHITDKFAKSAISDNNGVEYFPTRSNTISSTTSNGNGNGNGNGHGRHTAESSISSTRNFTTHDYDNPTTISAFTPKPGYKQWVAQAGTLVADLLTCAGADHVITMDLHDPQYQGFFDIPVDNLYGKALIQNYIQANFPDYREAVVVSPDAGGAKRATLIADSLKMDFALIHKVMSPILTQCPNSHPRRNVVLSSLQNTVTPA